MLLLLLPCCLLLLLLLSCCPFPADEQLVEAAKKLTGDIEQVPPMYSALHHNVGWVLFYAGYCCYCPRVVSYFRGFGWCRLLHFSKQRILGRTLCKAIVLSGGLGRHPSLQDTHSGSVPDVSYFDCGSSPTLLSPFPSQGKTTSVLLSPSTPLCPTLLPSLCQGKRLHPSLQDTSSVSVPDVSYVRSSSSLTLSPPVPHSPLPSPFPGQEAARAGACW